MSMVFQFPKSKSRILQLQVVLVFVLFQWQGSWFGAFPGDVVGGIGMGNTLW